MDMPNESDLARRHIAALHAHAFNQVCNILEMEALSKDALPLDDDFPAPTITEAQTLAHIRVIVGALRDRLEAAHKIASTTPLSLFQALNTGCRSSDVQGSGGPVTLEEMKAASVDGGPKPVTLADMARNFDLFAKEFQKTSGHKILWGPNVKELKALFDTPKFQAAWSMPKWQAPDMSKGCPHNKRGAVCAECARHTPDSNHKDGHA